MPLVRSRSEAIEIYREAGERGWTHPSFSTENLNTTEAILAGAVEHACALNYPELPLTVAVTHSYPDRRQTAAYCPSGDAVLGLRVFLSDLKALIAAPSPYADLRVIVHLDHGQPTTDAELLESPSELFCSVMFDASQLPTDENIAATRRYVQRHGDEVIVEGACDMIASAGNAKAISSTDPAFAEHYFLATGVDWLVADLGTEHRAGASTLRYRGDIAREINRRIGPRLSLHGTSSLTNDAQKHLFRDGIGKANVWTALERDSSRILLHEMVEHAALIAGDKVALQLQELGLLGTSADTTVEAALPYFTAQFRNTIVFNATKKKVNEYLQLWCPSQQPRGRAR